MSAFPIRTAALTVAAAIGLSACMSPYGYGGVGVGYGGGYGSYGYPGYGYGGYGYEPYWGWHDGYYYPGSGYYVYDRYRRAYPWDRHRDYWERRRENAMSSSEFRRQMESRRDQLDQQNWSGFEHGPSQVQRSQRIERGNRVQRIERSNSRSERGSSRSERSGSSKQSSKDFRKSMENRD